MAALPVIVVEDDPFTRLIPLVLDPNASEERRAAFTDFMSTDELDFAGWCARVRAKSPGLHPAEVRLVESEEDMRANLKDCVALVVESFRVGREDLAAAPKRMAVQKFGTRLRNIDAVACADQGIKLLTLRRRANISCAEHAFGLMLMLARKLDELDGLVTVDRIKAATGTYRPYQRQHTPGGNFARVGGTRALNGATIGIIGLGEIGREIAIRARAFDMNILYHQRTRVSESEERELSARYVPLGTLLAESDWIMPQLPTLPATRDFLGRAEFAQIKPGACLINVSNAAVINRNALIQTLRTNKLGGVALDIHYKLRVPQNDELLTFDNVILTPRMAGSPRFNGLNDFEQLITGLARELA
jgi:glyoxylate reductase/D-3-phosphoglycerate dehydrogenase